MARLSIVVSNQIYERLVEKTKKTGQSQAEIVRSGLVKELKMGGGNDEQIS